MAEHGVQNKPAVYLHLGLARRLHARTRAPASNFNVQPAPQLILAQYCKTARGGADDQ